jgi:hypothetical protein
MNNSTLITYNTRSAALSTRVAKPVNKLRIINIGIAISHFAMLAVFNAFDKSNF